MVVSYISFHCYGSVLVDVQTIPRHLILLYVSTKSDPRSAWLTNDDLRYTSLRVYAGGVTTLTDPRSIVLRACSATQWIRDQGRSLAPDLKFLADLKTSAKSAELCKLFYIFHAKRIRRIPFSFMVNSFPFVVIFLRKVFWSKIRFT